MKTRGERVKAGLSQAPLAAYHYGVTATPFPSAGVEEQAEGLTDEALVLKWLAQPQSRSMSPAESDAFWKDFWKNASTAKWSLSSGQSEWPPLTDMQRRHWNIVVPAGLAEQAEVVPPPLGQRVLLHQMCSGESTCCWCGAWRVGWLQTTCHPSLAGGPLRIGSAFSFAPA